MPSVTEFKIGDEVYVDTDIPNGWPGDIYGTGIREARIISMEPNHRVQRNSEFGFNISGTTCFPVDAKELITSYMDRQLEND